MIIPTEALNDIRRHGEETYPEECCGLLIGRTDEGETEVVSAHRAVNRNEDRRVDRYVIDPKDYLAADHAARERGMDVVGTYHSHPDHPARPSETDLKQATFPGYTYVIVSIREGRSDELMAWTLAPDRSRFLPEEIAEKKVSINL